LTCIFFLQKILCKQCTKTDHIPEKEFKINENIQENKYTTAK